MAKNLQNFDIFRPVNTLVVDLVFVAKKYKKKQIFWSKFGQKLVKNRVKIGHFDLFSAQKRSKLHVDYHFFEPLKVGLGPRETHPYTFRMYFIDDADRFSRPPEKVKWSSLGPRQEISRLLAAARPRPSIPINK